MVKKKIIIGSARGIPQGINPEGEQGIQFHASPYFLYGGKTICSIRL